MHALTVEDSARTRPNIQHKEGNIIRKVIKISSESMEYSYNKNLLRKIYEDEVKQQKGAIIFQKYCI